MKRAEFEAKGIHVAAVSYDSVEILQTFAERSAVGFPLLADPDYEVIDRFGIVNVSVPSDSPYYGYAYAGYYMIDKNGVVTSKYFNEENNNRTTSASILVRELGADGDSHQGQVETQHLVLKWSASNPVIRPGQRAALVLDIEPKGAWHVYSPEVEGYIPVSWTMSDDSEHVQFANAEYPPAKRLHLPAIDETVPVYDSAFRVLRDVRMMGGREFPEPLRGQKEISFDGELKYQACDDERCDFPQTVPIRWTLELSPHDLVRVPEEIQRSRE